jgi:hypothetical protein
MLPTQTAFEFEPPRASRASRPIEAAQLSQLSQLSQPALAIQGPRERAPAALTLESGAHAQAHADAERARSASLLERKLRDLLGREVALALTDNGRSMLSLRHRHDVAHVRLHHMFLHADDVTLRAVAGYLQGRPGAAVAHLRAFVDGHRALIKRQPPRQRKLRAIGHHHDLRAIFDALNADYFGNAIEARVSWGKNGRPVGRRRRRSCIKLGSYRHRDALINVHPVLDAAWVPAFFVEYIVYHEMVHHVVEAPSSGGRRALHGPEFRARERLFARYDEALGWERDNLDRLLSS